MAHEHDHVHGPDCGHDHAAGEAHTHAPTGEYYLEQLLTVFLCGAYGLAAVLMNLPRYRMLDIILAPEFHGWVTAGGVALLLFAAVRAVVLWRTVGQPIDCGHDHGPGEDHTHGNIYWRTVVLAFPLLLFLLGLPNQGFSKDWQLRRAGTDASISAGEVEAKAGDAATFEFHELNALAYDPDQRKSWEGRTVRIKGQLNKIGDREFTLFKLKMNCCAADIVPLKARVLTGFVPTLKSGDWVWAEGTLQFVEQPEKKQFIPVVRVKEAAGLVEVKNKAEQQ